MRMTLRWYGPDDAVSLANIRQIPGVTGVVSALAMNTPAVPWTRDSVDAHAARIAQAGLRWDVVESIPVSEEVKLGAPLRERHIEAWYTSLQHVARAGVTVVCYNFMPVFDWMRTDLARPMADGSTSLAYDDEALRRIDLSQGTAGLPGWGAAYDRDTLQELLSRWSAVGAEQLWENLAWFLERVVPVASELGVRLAIHPDDPPWPVFGLPRIITDASALERFVGLVDHPANGVTFCTGSLGAAADNDLPAMIRSLGARQRIHFMHARNVKRTAARNFHEVAHPSAFGSVDMRAVMQALADVHFDGPMRPDHGRDIWGEGGRPGYGLYDRALGAMYLQGLWEGVRSAVN
ncbi:MAG: mannonate dehydratase [Gemmatimonadaceae bacterium]|nr:mannonate dehydratase [Gemmatimonadaceae bacterium]